MAQQEIELVLMRQLASYLSVPVVIVDAEGSLLFYNEAAEAVFGVPFEEVPDLKAALWSALLSPRAGEGGRVMKDYPVLVALRTKQPLYDRFSMAGRDGKIHTSEGVAFPLQGQSGRLLGAVGIFWEIQGE